MECQEKVSRGSRKAELRLSRKGRAEARRKIWAEAQPRYLPSLSGLRLLVAARGLDRDRRPAGLLALVEDLDRPCPVGQTMAVGDEEGAPRGHVFLAEDRPA